MTTTMQRTIVCRTVKTKTLAAIGAIAAAVILPQIFHVLGAVSDLGTALGETFLPMHFSIFLVGFIAGPVTGLIVGALAPVVSFALTAMPSAMMLPFMVIELAGYGLAAGLMANTKLPVIGKLLVSQVAGRAVRAAAILLGYYAFSSTIAPASIWTGIVAGLPGLILQWIILPLLMFRITEKVQNDA